MWVCEKLLASASLQQCCIDIVDGFKAVSSFSLVNTQARLWLCQVLKYLSYDLFKIPKIPLIFGQQERRYSQWGKCCQNISHLIDTVISIEFDVILDSVDTSFFLSIDETVGIWRSWSRVQPLSYKHLIQGPERQTVQGLWHLYGGPISIEQKNKLHWTAATVDWKWSLGLQALWVPLGRFSILKKIKAHKKSLKHWNSSLALNSYSSSASLSLSPTQTHHVFLPQIMWSRIYILLIREIYVNLELHSQFACLIFFLLIFSW